MKLYETVSLPGALYDSVTWSLTLREERRLRVFENRVLRGIFGPKREKVEGGWGRLHNEDLHNLYDSPHIKGNEIGARCSTRGKDEKCLQKFGRIT
jgi:hypothetical protein